MSRPRVTLCPTDLMAMVTEPFRPWVTRLLRSERHYTCGLPRSPGDDVIGTYPKYGATTFELLDIYPSRPLDRARRPALLTCYLWHRHYPGPSAAKPIAELASSDLHATTVEPKCPRSGSCARTPPHFLAEPLMGSNRTRAPCCRGDTARPHPNTHRSNPSTGARTGGETIGPCFIPNKNGGVVDETLGNLQGLWF